MTFPSVLSFLLILSSLSSILWLNVIAANTFIVPLIVSDKVFFHWFVVAESNLLFIFIQCETEKLLLGIVKLIAFFLLIL